MSIILRPATMADVPRLQHWDRQAHVIAASPEDEWLWDIELARHPDWRAILIAERHQQQTRDKGRPIGCVQIIDPAREETHYWGSVPPHLRAIDIWIGEESDLGHGYGTAIMRLALGYCFKELEVCAVLVDPLAMNQRARHFYEKLGFQFVEYRHFECDYCAVYRFERAQLQSLPPDSTA